MRRQVGTTGLVYGGTLSLPLLAWYADSIQVPLAESPRAQAAGYIQYGTKWLKALYRGYTDDSFGEYSEQPPWQGTQGPTLRGEVNDLIEIMFVNKLTDHYATM